VERGIEEGLIDAAPWANRPHPGRPTVPFKLSPEHRRDIEAAMRPGKVERRVFQRARALLLMADGVPTTDIARLLGVQLRTVFRWRTRVRCDHREQKLADAPRSGHPPSLSTADYVKIVVEACRLPSDVGVPVTHWSHPLPTNHLQRCGIALSGSTLGRVLRDGTLEPHRQKMWLTSHDDDVRRGKLFGFVSEDHNSATFVDLLDVIDVCYPTGRGHLICDNVSMHETDDVVDWFEDHPRWKRHFTPKHASWLNLIGASCACAPCGQGRQTLKSTLTVLPLKSATARSGRPSPLKSAAATAAGPSPAP